jgi:hypothetical protein
MSSTTRRAIWLARLRVALRWFWPHDLAILTGALTAPILTGALLGPRAGELNPLAAALTARFGYVPAGIGTAMLAGGLVLAVQTVCVAHSFTGKRWARVFTWTMLALVTEYAFWGVTQVLTMLH